MNPTGPRHFYFSLFRLLALFRGGDARRAESNGFEAWLLGLAIYAIHYLFFVRLFISTHLASWQVALLLLANAFWIWLFWLLLLYINSVIIQALRVGGLFRTIPIRRAQSILWGICTTAMACALLDGSPALREFGAIWLVAVAMNLAAAVILAFCDGAHRPGK
jgi:hypothetical protein